jgi:hypothetical protein
MTAIRKNEATAAKRRVALYVYTDDGVSPAPLATDFSAAGVVQVRLGGFAYVNAGGSFTNTGIDGEWVYEFTQAETNVSVSELGVKVEKAGFLTRITTVPVLDPADVNDVNVVTIANNVITAPAIDGGAITEIQAGLAVEATVEAAIIAGTATIETDLLTLASNIADGTIPVTVGTINADVITASALASDAVDEITAAIFAFVTETGITFVEAIRGMFGVMLGEQVDEKLQNHVDPVVLKSADGTKDRVTATITGGTKTVVRDLS